MSLTNRDYERCARRIAGALCFQPGESVLLKIDPRIFTEIVEPLRSEIWRAGAHVSGTILADDTREGSEAELESMRRLFEDADVFIWLPELHQGNTPSVRRALDEWLDRKRGRSVHFHWASGTYPLPGLAPPRADLVDRTYLAALQVTVRDLDTMHERAISLLRTAPVRIQTAQGTDLTFSVGDRPFSKQTGDASPEAATTWTLRIDRDVEMPSGVLRVAPIETSANGKIFLPVWDHLDIATRALLLTFERGVVVDIQGPAGDVVDRALTEAGGAAKTFREFALGFNPVLAINPNQPYIGYYGYGAGVVRLSLGDNLEMGGANRGGGVYWNFITNATVTVGTETLVQNGKLMV